MQDERKLRVLRAIIEDYIATQEPVGSRLLSERHDLGVSPATLRNDMAALENEGYLEQPHTSAGRIPTAMGYRLFVDQLSTVKPLSPAEQRAIMTFLEGAADLDDVMSRTTKVLSQLTKQAAIVQYPSLSKTSIRHVELVKVTDRKILLVLVTEAGRVEQRYLDCPAEITDSDVAQMRNKLNAALVGVYLSDFQKQRKNIGEHFSETDRDFANLIVDALVELADREEEERVVIGGTANLARYASEYQTMIRPVLEALEEQVVLLRLIGEAVAPDISVKIGIENPSGLESAAVVTSGYQIGDHTVARLGVVGPTHMDYPTTMGAVLAVSNYVGSILAGK
ncbi:MAG: Heat-inducible transcription repressor HrcA [Actinomycetota bacterium]|jgi:heat-inducible transcriptional repressor